MENVFKIICGLVVLVIITSCDPSQNKKESQSDQRNGEGIINIDSEDIKGTITAREGEIEITDEGLVYFHYKGIQMEIFEDGRPLSEIKNNFIDIVEDKSGTNTLIFDIVEEEDQSVLYEVAYDENGVRKVIGYTFFVVLGDYAMEGFGKTFIDYIDTKEQAKELMGIARTFQPID